MDDVEKALEMTWGFEYDEVFDISSDIRFRFRDAGHILGSAALEIWGDGKKLTVSGDIGNWGTPILRDPSPIEETDYLLIESTYGDRKHRHRSERSEFLKEIIIRSLKDGGHILIPAFSIGRTQEILYELNHLVENGLIPQIPVILDSPLGISATEIYRRHPECYDEDALALVNSGDDVLDFPRLIRTQFVSQSKRIRGLEVSGIIIAGSGMCNSGRIRYHIRDFISDPRTDILFVGYQAWGTLGRGILQGAPYVWVLGDMCKVEARVHSISGYSAHADRDGLIRWFSQIGRFPERTFVVHGEEGASYALSQRLGEAFGVRTYIPRYGEVVDW